MRALVILSALIVATATAAAVAIAGGGQSTLAQVRAATAKYHDVAAAKADGYDGEGEPCVFAPPGTMGYHHVNMPLVMNPALDATRPEILVYAPTGDGGRRLVAVEYMQVALANTPNGPAPWFEAGPPPGGFFTPKPSLLDTPFDGPMAGHNPQMPWHYDLHLWIWKPNPSGMFSMWNPKFGC